MKKHLTLLLFLFLFILLTGCSNNTGNVNNIDNSTADAISIVRTEDFIMKLQMDKICYKTDDEISIIASIEYIGSKKNLTILTGSRPLLIDINGVDNDFEFLSVSEDVEIEKTLELNKPNVVEFDKMGDLVNSENEGTGDFYNTEFLKLKKGTYDVSVWTRFDYKNNQQPVKLKLTHRIYVE